jgi:hypothetical protein
LSRAEICMNTKQWYTTHFESGIRGRYITLEHIRPLLESCQKHIEISMAGFSELGKEIPLLKIGNGENIILGWSQMHGNESTTTKAIFDFIKFIGQKEFFQSEIKNFLQRNTFFIIPILNPDGAMLYTRENANSVDLNRDAQDLSQKESQVLRTVFNQVQPKLCLNLHDQRSIYGLRNGKGAAVSFLAPSANVKRSLTPSRQLAMDYIVRLYCMLEKEIPGQVGRYDDTFNANCVGDTFQMAGVPTILFEAGHLRNDYMRENTRALIFYSFLELFEITNQHEPGASDYNDYFSIPENVVSYQDVILKQVKIKGQQLPVDIAIQFSEILKNGNVNFNPVIEKIGHCDSLYGHFEIDVKGSEILINSQEEYEVGQIISEIVNKNDNSVINILNK